MTADLAAAFARIPPLNGADPTAARRLAGLTNVNHVIDWRLIGRPFPVVAAINSRTTRAEAIYRKVRSRWQDVCNDVRGLETRHAVARLG